MKKFAVALSVLGLIALCGALGAPRAWAQDDDDGPMSNMHFVVVRDASGKPVKNAAVVLHPVKKNGKQSMGGLELKTDEEGKTWIDGIPYGVLRVQVLAPGFRTFGEDYEIKQPETEIIVRLKRPDVAVLGVRNRRRSRTTGSRRKSRRRIKIPVRIRVRVRVTIRRQIRPRADSPAGKPFRSEAPVKHVAALAFFMLRRF